VVSIGKMVDYIVVGGGSAYPSCSYYQGTYSVEVEILIIVVEEEARSKEMVSILLQLVEEGEAAIIRVGVQQPLCWME
jgi:hypothetical protein